MNGPLGRVAVFWHIDSLPPPCFGGSPRELSLATYNAVSGIRQALYKYGIVTCFRAYICSMVPQAKWELQSHGVTVIECHWNSSDTMITVDMFRFALDNPSFGNTLVLISSSFTLAYTVSVLSARRYRVALISPLDPRSELLTGQASEVIDWGSVISRGNINHQRPVHSPPVTQNTPDSSVGHSTVGRDPHGGPAGFPHNAAKTLEHSFTISDLDLARNSGERSASPHTNSATLQLEVRQPPPVNGRPPSREIEEAILNNPVIGEIGQKPGPRSFDSKGRPIDLLIRPFDRSVSELALGVDPGTVRPRANSLQDDRRPNSPPGNLTLEDHILMRSLPMPNAKPSSFCGLGPKKPLDVEALPFVPSNPNTPPNEPLEDAPTAISPPAPDPGPIEDPVEETRLPPPRLEGIGSASPACSASSTPSTVKPVVVQVTNATKPTSDVKRRFTQAERRAVETVINVLLELKSKGKTHVSPKELPPLILAKDRAVYRGVGSRGNRFWKLIGLGVEMGWLEAGPRNTWIDVGNGWAE